MRDITTLQVPVKDINDVAKRAYNGFVEKATQQWDKKVNDFWEKNKNNRWFWIGKLHWKSIKDIEIYLGKPKKKGDRIRIETVYWKYWHHTDQGLLYRNISELHEKNPDAIITMSIEQYNVLRTYDD